MKRIIPLLISILLTGGISAQDFEVSINGNIKSDNDTVIFYVDADSAEFSFNALFINASNNGVNVKVLRTLIDTLNGSEDYYTWGNTAGPESDTSSNYLFVPAGATSYDTLIPVFEPKSIIGTSLVKYTFFNIDFFEDNISFFVEFHSSPTGIWEQYEDDIVVSNVYPNPAITEFSLDYDIPAQLGNPRARVINMLGNVIEEKFLNPGKGKLQILTSGLNNGIYFVIIDIDGKLIATKKVVVK